jgi:hypothetical protein
MSFLRDDKGIDLAEFLVAALLVIAVIGSMIYTIANTTRTEGQAVNTWIDSINVPASI